VILLDTHVIAWLATEPERLSRQAASAIRRARSSDGLAASDISLWELALLFSRGALRTHGTIENAIEGFINNLGLTLKPVTAEIAGLAIQFSVSYPKDPVDRIIGATAWADGMVFVTRDEKIRNCPLIKTVW